MLWNTHYLDRWRLFCVYAYENNVKSLEQVTAEFVTGYGQHLQRQLEAGAYKSASAPKNYVSAVNSVMRLATKGKWKSVKPGKDCGIEKRRYIPKESKSVSDEMHTDALSELDDLTVSLLNLQREFGLRFKESCLLSPKSALKQVDKFGYFILRAGTKGGRARRIYCDDDGKHILEIAARIQGSGKSMVPRGVTYDKFRRECYVIARKFDFGYHSERHSFAQGKYKDITTAPSPIEAGWKEIPRKKKIEKLAEYLGVSISEAETIDKRARLRISEDLGHSRTEITNAYLG